jgi:choline-glycine betaine transporter
MSDAPTRREIDAELRAAEARTETRIAQLNSAMEVRAAATDHKIDLLIGKIDALSITVAEVKVEAKADSRVTRTTVWGVGIAVMGLVVALWVAGLNAQSNMIAAFQAGMAIRSLPQDSGQPKVPSR